MPCDDVFDEAQWQIRNVSRSKFSLGTGIASVGQKRTSVPNGLTDSAMSCSI